MILSTIKKLNKIYKEIQFYYRYIFLLSFLTSLTLSIFEGFFLSVIFNLTNNLLGNTTQNINLFGDFFFWFSKYKPNFDSMCIYSCMHNSAKNYKYILDNYEYIFILDGDLIISIEDINKMFNIINDKHLYIIGPSFINNYNYKSNWHINKYNKYNQDLKYTNFVEVNAPLMKVNCLYNLFNTLRLF